MISYDDIANMLKTHLDSMETTLLARSRVAANTGHSLHKGTPREVFIREFLASHLSEKVAIGTGEIIDCNSSPNPPATNQRHQYDVVIFKRDYPKLDIGGGITAFLAESVVATIEVKSTLNKEEFETSMRAARSCKQLARNIVTSFTAGHQSPAILNYIVAYDGPAKMSTVQGWVQPTHAAMGISGTALPIGDERYKQPSPSIDGVFVLGTGFMLYDNLPFGFITDDLRKQHPGSVWQFTNSTSGNLLWLFLSLTAAISGISASWLNPLPYLQDVRISGLGFAP